MTKTRVLTHKKGVEPKRGSTSQCSSAARGRCHCELRSRTARFDIHQQAARVAPAGKDGSRGKNDSDHTIRAAEASTTRTFTRRIVQRMRIERIKQAQEEESWIANLKKYLVGDLTQLNAEDAKLCARIAPDYDVDKNDLLFFSL